jgi:hypothetical protein
LFWSVHESTWLDPNTERARYLMQSQRQSVPRLGCMKVITITDDGQPRLSKTERTRNRRATGSGVIPPSDEHRPPGPVELGIIAECESLAMADERPALAAVAKLLARHLDNEQYSGMHVQCHRALAFAMKPLRGKAKRNRLAAIRMLSK